MLNRKSIAITKVNSKNINKPNEDSYLCDDKNGIYILVDGVSRDKINGIYPNPSPAKEVSELFVNKVYDYFINCKSLSLLSSPCRLLYEMVYFGNNEIKKYNNEKIWMENFLPGTVGIIAIVRTNILYYAYIGDCYGFIINNDNHKVLFTECQTEKIHFFKGRFDRQTIRNEICNNKKSPYSYGVLNGDDRALDFLRIGIKELHDNDKIILCSDGFEDIVINNSLELYNMQIDDIVEKSDCDDDKTMIIVEDKI